MLLKECAQPEQIYKGQPAHVPPGAPNASCSVTPRQPNPRPPLTLHRDDTGNLIAGVGPGVGAEFVKAYFPKSRTIRVASAYFSLTGYKIGRLHTVPDIQFHLLVGKEDGTSVKNAVLDEIGAELQGCEEDLWKAVVDLVERMEVGRFKIRDARSMRVPFHCKFYICDQRAMWHGSANFSKNGLLHNSEQIVATTVPEEIALFTGWYDEVADHATDLLEELLKLLKQWLALHPPFDAYLKILYLLSTLPELQPGEGGHAPTYYQQAVVARCLRQIADYGGTLAVLATGLGKTIVGAELAHRLRSNEEIDTVILLAPNAVREAWAAEMDGRGLNHRFFPTDILFRPDSSRRHHLISQISRQLRRADEKTLILIDEAHFYRNQILREKQTQQPSRVFVRLLPAVGAGAKIVLLTATAYGTNSKNFDSLLNLLPHRQRDPVGVPGPWQARNPDEFSKLPVVTILGLPDVLALARRRGDVDAENRPFVKFQHERRYLPDPIHLIPVFYELPLQSAISKAFDASCFDHAFRIPQVGYDDDAGEFDTASDAGYNAALNSWLSSPPAMEELISHNLATKDLDEQLTLAEQTVPGPDIAPDEDANTGQFELLSTATPPRATGAWGYGKGAVPYSQGIDWREKFLKPLRVEIGNAPDQKLQKLLGIVRLRCADEGGKTLIFVRRHRTAVYVYEKIQKYLPHLDVACTIEERDGKTALKPRHARDEILRSFSPRSHREPPEAEHDVLVCTDADGVGVNLQDADNVVNYDPPSGADVLFQRAGRVLRMTPSPTRNVRVYTMIPSLVHDSTDSRVTAHVRERFKRLNRRHDKSREVTGSALLSTSESVDVMKESDLRVEDWFREVDPVSSLDARVENSLEDHMGILAEHGEHAASLPQPIHTAKTMKRLRRPRVVVFFTVDGEYHAIVHQPNRGRIREIDFRELFQLSRCTPDEPRAPTRGENIEAAGNTAVQLWCSEKDVDISSAKKICVIYLQPTLESTDPRLLLFPLPGSS